MKYRLYIAVIMLFILFFAIGVNTVYAPWSSLKSDYAITTDYHGVEDIWPGTSITAWAGTTDQTVVKVEFEWKNETDDVVFEENVTVFGPYTTPNVPTGVPQEITDWSQENTGYVVLYASNIQVPEDIGDWGVQALFYGEDGHIRGQDSDIVAIRATSIHVTPEVPFGTIAIILAMFGALAFFTIRKRKTNLPL